MKFKINYYITKFLLSLIAQHPDFVSSALIMDVFPSGSYDIITEAGMPALILSSPSLSPATYTNQSFTLTRNYSTDVYYLTDSQSLSVTEKTNSQILLDLSCSLSSSTSIVFSISSYNNQEVPSWVAVDANTGLLSLTSPEVEQNINYSFYVDAVITEVSKKIQRVINLTVKDWSTWGSQTAKTLSITVQSIVWIIITISVFTSILNMTSLSSIWSLINQVQLFFLLLMTRSYIPDDVKLIITGLNFLLNLPLYFSFNRMTVYNYTLNNFNFELSNYSLSYVEVNSDSSISNTASFFIITLMMIVINFVVLTLCKLIAKCQIDLTAGWFAKTVKWIVDKLYNLLTFSYYIRTALEMNQYLLICSLYEIYNFNTSNPYRIASLVFAVLLLLGWLLTAVFAFCLSISSYTVDEDKHNKLGEYFSGLKLDIKFKFYIFILIVRRTVFVISLVTWVLVASRLLIGILAILQLIYLAYVCYLRPFKEIKDNLVEIINELYFYLLLSSLVYLNTKSNWSPLTTTIYMWVI